ncbi:RagB/SusD family nutrient uptake outer membrane protein [Aliifodinibius salicampi]|uniref:RagB/SusD family nutrient uptake outer membrane protein n=1 Tax=Fodinibius salicampi TaxID=1920655 RepID=A0ABT3PVJ9_9BACT|nr:RagB/SusD family nutrient uptake outer membrane protein [Fodinibius salicampi]MCW9711884.1 RagB/SusD family nutrient uptake outer membrane protein [Fodinibius salicampi]
MKNLTYISTLLCVMLLVITACDVQEALDQEPLDQISEEAVWDDPALIEAYVNDIYLGMGHGLYEVMLSSAADETHFTHGYGIPDIVESNITPSNRGSFASRGDYNHWDWPDLYFRIQQVNTLLSEIEDSAIEDQAIIDSYVGQAHFLRAYFYHNLLRIYGGVPILTEPASLDDEDLTPARNSFAETVDFIVQEAELAAERLPVTQSGDDLGRASGGAALALKSRVLLYAASDLFHQNPSGMAVTGYSGADQQQMWQDAKDAAQAVMDLGAYNLFRPNPASAEEASQNYHELFLTEAPSNPETIMERYFIETRDDGHNPGLDNGPNGYHNWAGNTPLQNIVDDYEMADGSEFDWSNPEHAANPYENRDPRLEASILHDGSDWVQRPADAVQYDGDNIVQTFKQLELPDGSVVPGVDTRDGPIEDWNGSYTGYYLKKFIRDDMQHGTSGKQEGSWIFFRYTEVLLNYVEASIELGDYADARRELNKIRTRAGMPTYDATVTGDELMEEYRNEKRIEMAFEEQRYFDVRRWMIAPEEMNETAKNIIITADGEEQADRSTYSNYTYEVGTQVPGNRAWEDKMYFQPIPFEEMNRNDELVQNPNY